MCKRRLSSQLFIRLHMAPPTALPFELDADHCFNSGGDRRKSSRTSRPSAEAHSRERYHPHPA